MVRQQAKPHIDLPTDRLPEAAGLAKLHRLRAPLAKGLRDAERGNPGVAEVEDDVAWREIAYDP